MIGDSPQDWRPFRKLEMPGTGHIVEKTSHGEHHMGAETVEFILPFELDGRTSLVSTNGSLSMSADRRYLYLGDATTILRVDCASLEVSNVSPPPGHYFKHMEDTGEEYVFAYYGRKVDKQEERFERAEAPFVPGMGRVQDGRFPSAV